MNDQTNVSNNHQDDDDEIDLLQLLNTLLDGKWLILFFAICAATIAFIYANGQTPIYKADALLQVEKKPGSIPGIEGLAGLGGDDTSISTELELLKSRRVLGQAVDDLKLDIVVQPKKIPILGNFYHRIFNPDETAKLPEVWDRFDDFSSQYAWGKESIKLSHLEVPTELLDKPLTLIIKKDKAYELFFNDVLLLTGKVGEFSTSKDNTIKITVAELIGLPETKYIVMRQSKLVAISNLQNTFKVSEKGKKTGIISLVLEGPNKVLLVKIIDHISKHYVSQNTARSAEEASKSLQFLKEQIKPVKKKVDKAEAQLSQYRTRNGTANMSMETQHVLALIADIDTELQKTSLQRAKLAIKYTVNHPSMKVLIDEEKKLKKRKNEAKSDAYKLPKKQQELLKFENELQVSNTIYHQLLNDIQKFKIAKASKVGNAYIVDSPVAYAGAIKPKKSLILALGVLLGLMLGVVIVFLREALHQTVDNPEKVEIATGISVYATVPLSKGVSLTRAFKDKARKQKSLLALDDTTDPAIESLRSLRTSLHFALLEAKNNIVMITGPSPAIGKSFISSNFAAVLSAGEQRILLIDADMRKGYLHKLLNVPMSPGLSELISNKSTVDEIIHNIKVGDKSMDIITRGETPPNPSELLMHSHFEELLTKVSGLYDLILIDTPPVHAVTDSTIIGSLAGVTFMVVRNNHHSMKEIEHAVTRLSHTNIETKGFIFNGYVAKKARYGYDYGYNAYYGDYKSD